MSNRIDKIAGELAAIIKNADAKSTEGYDTPGTVRRIEGDTAWVHIPGGVDETPVKLTIAAKEGDTVQLRVAGGSAWLVGNQSAPPTDDATANRAAAIATKAEATAESVEDTANTANLNAAAAIKRAAAAQKIADTTNQYFWFVGTAFSLTEDTEVEEGKTYYQRVGEKYIAVVPEGTEDPSEQGWYEQTASDTGAHITEVPQDEFTDSPSGGNLLARSNGIAVREGLTELATFTGDGVQIGETSGSHTTMDIEAFRQYGSDGVKRLEIGDTDTGNYIYEVINRTFTAKGTFTISKPPKKGTPIYVVIDTFVDTTWELKQHHVLLTAGTSGSGQNTEYDGDRTFTITPLATASPTKVRLVIYAVEGKGSAYTFGERNESNKTPYGEKSMAIGSEVMAYAPNSMAVGVGATASYPGQVALGRYPIEDETGDFALLIGNGSDSDNPGVTCGITWDGDVRTDINNIDAKAGTLDANIVALISELGWYDALQ